MDIPTHHHLKYNALFFLTEICYLAYMERLISTFVYVNYTSYNKFTVLSMSWVFSRYVNIVIKDILK